MGLAGDELFDFSYRFPADTVNTPTDPGSGDPGNGAPGSGNPGNGDPGTGDPGSGDPGTGDPYEGNDPGVPPYQPDWGTIIVEVGENHWGETVYVEQNTELNIYYLSDPPMAEGAITENDQDGNLYYAYHYKVYQVTIDRNIPYSVESSSGSANLMDGFDPSFNTVNRNVLTFAVGDNHTGDLILVYSGGATLYPWNTGVWHEVSATGLDGNTYIYTYWIYTVLLTEGSDYSIQDVSTAGDIMDGYNPPGPLPPPHVPQFGLITQQVGLENISNTVVLLSDGTTILPTVNPTIETAALSFPQLGLQVDYQYQTCTAVVDTTMAPQFINRAFPDRPLYRPPNLVQVSTKVGQDHFGHAIARMRDGNSIYLQFGDQPEQYLPIFYTDGRLQQNYGYFQSNTIVDANLFLGYGDDRGGDVIYDPPQSQIDPNPLMRDVTFILPDWRTGHPLSITGFNNNPTIVINPNSLSEGTITTKTIYPNTPDQRTITLQNKTVTAAVTVPIGQVFTLHDETEGDSFQVDEHQVLVDLSAAQTLQGALSLTIAASRWNHTLVIHGETGETFSVLKGTFQGSWTLYHATDQTQFVPNWTFSATATLREHFHWWLFDVTTGEALPQDQSDSGSTGGSDALTDADGDGLPDWYENIAGLGPNSPPTPLPDGGNTPQLPVYGTPVPGGTTGDITDPSHETGPTPLPHVTLPFLNISCKDPNPHDAEGHPTPPDKTTIRAKIEWPTPGRLDPKVVSLSLDFKSGTEDWVSRPMRQQDDTTGDWTTLADPDDSTDHFDDNGLIANLRQKFRLNVTYDNGMTFAVIADYTFSPFNGIQYSRAETTRTNPGNKFLVTVPYTFYLDEIEKSHSRAGDVTQAWTGAISKAGGNLTLISTPAKDNDQIPFNYQMVKYEPLYSTRLDNSGCSSVDPSGDSMSIEFSNEYKFEDFLTDTISLPPKYNPPVYYGDKEFGSALFKAAERASYWDQSGATLTRAAYQMLFFPATQGNFTWYEIFFPENDPYFSGDAKKTPIPPTHHTAPTVVGTHTVSLGETAAAAGLTTIDPGVLPDDDRYGPNADNGKYYLLFPWQIAVEGVVNDPLYQDGGSTQVVSLIPDEKDSGRAVLTPPGQNGERGVSSTLSLTVPDDYDLPLQTSDGLKINFTNSQDFEVTYTVNGASLKPPTVSNGQLISMDDLRTFFKFSANAYQFIFKITPKATAVDGETCKLTINEIAFGITMASDSTTYTVRLGVGRNFTVPFEEAAGSRYRKIGLNGVPLPDEKPHETAESDQQKEETFIDALTLGLNYDVTDIYVRIPGSDLALSVRRNWNSEIWNMREGLRPHERMDRPFGAGWSSNICVYVEHSSTVAGNPPIAIIHDQDGKTHRFLQTSTAFVPLPSDSRENSDYLCTFDGITFKDRYGTTLTFSDPNLMYSVLTQSDRDSASSIVSTGYQRVTTIEDRFGNTINYTYHDYDTLVPETISVAGAIELKLSILQIAGRIQTIWDPNGQAIQYSYTHPDNCKYSYEGNDYSEMVLDAVTNAESEATRFTYDFAVEPDTTPPSLETGPGVVSRPTDKYHIDLASITDPQSNEYDFSYVFDHSKKDRCLFVSPSAGAPSGWSYYPESGAPRNVSKVTLPGGLGQTVFTNDSLVCIDWGHEPADTQTTPPHWFLTPDSHRVVTVEDPKHQGVTYTFGAGTGGAQVFEVGGFYSGNTPPAVIPKIIFYTTMKIEMGGGHEDFTFTPDAGLALKSVLDFSGNTTTYKYDDAFNPAQVSSAQWGALFPYPSFFTRHTDPTEVDNALSQAKTFHYAGRYRIQDEVVDEQGARTHNDVDSLGRRTAEYVYGPTNTVIRETHFSYDPSRKGIITEKRVVKREPSEPGSDLVTSYSLYPNGRILSETVDPGGLSLVTTYTYDNNGNILSIQNPRKYTTYFEYDGFNRLKKTIYPDKSAKRISYYPGGDKHTETDENEHSTDWEYDAMHRMTKQTRYASPDNIVTLQSYDNAVDPKSWVWNPNNHLTHFEYDSLQRLTAQTQYCDGDQYLTSYGYGANSGAFTCDSSTFKPTSIVDARGYVTSLTYDSIYRPRTKTSQFELGQFPKFAQTLYSYDDVNNYSYAVTPAAPVDSATDITPVDASDAQIHTVRSHYDGLKRVDSILYGDGITEGTQFTSTGLAWKHTDELQLVTEAQYDGAGRPIFVISPPVDDGLDPSNPSRSSHLKSAITQTQYDEAGNIVRRINPLNKIWDYDYDARNRKIKEQAPSVLDAATGAGARPTLQWGYDYVGNQRWSQDARGYTTETLFDEANRPYQVTQPRTYVYDKGAGVVRRPQISTTYLPGGQIHTVTDDRGNKTVNGYDGADRLESTTVPGYQVSYAYDQVGNRISVQDGRTHTTTLSYDGFKRLTGSFPPIGGSTTFNFDALNKIQRKDGTDALTNYSYDPRGRLTGVEYPSHPEADETYQRDAAGNLQHVIVATSEKNVDYTYDALRRVTSETSNSGTHAYLYDLAGNRVWAHFSSGRQITYDYDDANRLATVDDGTIRQTQYAYDLSGNAMVKALPDSEIVRTGHDCFNRISAERGDSPGGTLYETGLAYDGAGNLCVSQETQTQLPEGTRFLDYDGANRLTHEQIVDAGGQSTHDVSYTYDAASNRTTKIENGVTTTYNYDDANRLTSWGRTDGSTATYSYDGSGNRKTRSVSSVNGGDNSDSYTFDEENRLVQVEHASGGTFLNCSYEYDYRCRRILRSENGVITNSVFSGGTSVQETTQDLGGATTSVEFVRGSDRGGGVGGILYNLHPGNGANGIPSYPHFNARGDVTTRTDETGAVSWQATYEAGGTRIAEFGTTSDRQKANSKDEDPTGLLNEGMRYRDLETDTFITPDPAGFVDGPNLYAYVTQNPWTKFDPEGLFEWGYMFHDMVHRTFGIGGVGDRFAQGITQAALVGSDIIGYGMASACGAGEHYDGNSKLFHGMYEHPEHYNVNQTRKDILVHGLKSEANVMTFGGYSYGEGVATGNWEEAQDAAFGTALGAATARALPGSPKGVKGGERAGKDFTALGKRLVIQANQEKYGTTTCEECQKETVPATQSKSPAPDNLRDETRVDHVYPKSQGGDGSPRNGQVLCFDCNEIKSDSIIRTPNPPVGMEESARKQKEKNQ